MDPLLSRLGIEPVNPGAFAGSAGWLSAQGASPIVSREPATGTAIAAVIPAGDREYEEVIRSSREAFASWRTVPAPRRGLLVRDIASAVRESQEPLGELVTREMGKIRAEGIGEVQEMVDVCDFAVGLSRTLGGPTLPSERPGHRIYEQWHPAGPVGVITAFNFPVAVYSWNAAVAAVCGDTLVWKPSPLTPLCSIALERILQRVAADHGCAGLFTLLVADGSAIGERMTADPRLPVISFTGSAATGRRVAQAVAARIGRAILELGGNNAIIACEDADLELAVPAIVFAAAGTAGQRCTTARRLIVHREIADGLRQRLVSAYGRIAIGNPMDPRTRMGPLASEGAVEAMMSALDRARRDGGTVLFGGRRLLALGPRFVEPAIVAMPSQTALVCEETFAPILYVMEYDSFEEALALHNGVPQGLSSAIFTRSISMAERFLAATGSDCGIANVNVGTSGAEIGGAFGGEKASGGGRESGSDAWKGYMRRQTTTVNYSGRFDLAQGMTFEG